MRVLARLWRPLDLAPLVAGARFLERCRGLRLVADDVVIAGVRCTVAATGAAARDWLRLRRLWRRDPHHARARRDESAARTAADAVLRRTFDVVLHVHGGAFVAAFEVGHWRYFHMLAAATPRAIVVMPTYDVAPGARYPAPVDQCLAVADAVRAGDLGFQSLAAYGVGDAKALLAAAASPDAIRRRRARELPARNPTNGFLGTPFECQSKVSFRSSPSISRNRGFGRARRFETHPVTIPTPGERERESP